MPWDHSEIVQAKITGPLGGFGELLTAQLTPRFQYTFDYNVSANIFREVSAVGGGAASILSSELLVQSGAAPGGQYILETRRVLQYRAGMGGRVRFTARFTDCDSADGFALIGLMSDQDGYGVGFQGGVFGAFHRINGGTEFYPSYGWSDTLDGSNDASNQSSVAADWSKGNIFEIVYQYLGYGNARFAIALPESGVFSPFFSTKWINRKQAINLGSPSMPFRVEVFNGSEAKDARVYSGSVAAFLDGSPGGTGLHWGKSASAVGIGTSPVNVLTMRSAATFAGKTNRIPSQVELVRVAVEGTKPAIARVIKNATPAGAVFTPLDADTPLEYDTAGAWTGGRVIAEIPLAKVDSVELNLHDYGIQLIGSETLTIDLAATSGTTDGVAAIIMRDER